MIRITVEVVPHGDESLKRVAGYLEIANDGTGNKEVGNYDLRIDGKDFWMQDRLEGFERNRGLWSCVYEALRVLDLGYLADKKNLSTTNL